ncbi:rhotekin-like [Aplochiton taeniatus]
MFSRNKSSRATVCRGSALELEIRPRRFRTNNLVLRMELNSETLKNMNIFDTDQDGEVQRQIEREVRMREGASKLLAACSQKEQALEASKSLLTCNARILALLSQLQRMREAQVLQRVGRRASDGASLDERSPCLGKVAISDLRIPLMWKDSEYFKNKGELHRCAVFCLLHCGREIRDTDLVMVDRTLTDICFEDTIMFNDVGPGFELRVELFSSCVSEDFPLGALGTRRLSRLGGSLGRTSGKKLRAALESATGYGSNTSGGGGGGSGSPPLSPPLSTQGPKYQLLAFTTLKLEHVQDGFRTHDLPVLTTEDSSFWLPLYGKLCCRLVAQPLCMTQQVVSGPLKVKLGEESDCWKDIYGVLRGANLICYQSQEEMECEKLPLFTISVNKSSRICASEREPIQRYQSICIRTQFHGQDVSHTVATHTPEDKHWWMGAFRQHFYDMSRWSQCCDDLMKIEEPSTRRSTLVTAKQGSLYHEMVTPTSPGEGLVIQNNAVSAEIRALLTTYYDR